MTKSQDQDVLRKQDIGMIAALCIQYLLGMTTNLFVKFPDTKNVGKLWEFSWKQIPLALHIILGFLLLIGSSAFIVRSIRSKDKKWIVISTIGFSAILIAGLSGATFIRNQTDIYSYIMAITFILAFLAYAWG